jgi:hypothetical protein
MLQQIMTFTCLLPEISGEWIPIVGVLSGTVMVVAIVAIASFNKHRRQEMEHVLQLRRMEHERRMKELDLELARIQSGTAAQRQ